jgi:hypothetical protein
MDSLLLDKMIKKGMWNGTEPDTNNWLVKEYVGGIKLLININDGGIILL